MAFCVRRSRWIARRWSNTPRIGFKDLASSVDKTLQDSEAINPDPNRRNVTQAVLNFGVGNNNNNVFTLREREFGNRQSITKNLAALNRGRQRTSTRRSTASSWVRERRLATPPSRP